jgi:hypothetical protein
VSIGTKARSRASSTRHGTEARSRASSTPRYGDEKPQGDLFQMLGEGDTSALYARKVTRDIDHDVPYGGGNSVDGRTVISIVRFIAS